MDNKYKYRLEIQQMMFVSGETNDPPVETTTLIEDIVKGQVIEILLAASKTAHSRSSKVILPDDIIFQMRHDKAKVNRLRTYLSWKDLRKNAKDQDAGSGGAAGVPGAPGGEDDTKGDKEDKDGIMTKVKKSQIKLPWELQFMFNEQAQDDENDMDDDEREASIITMKRLKMADDRTKNMTKEEYVHWSDCRQASFTFRKAKRFKDWSGINQLTEGKPHDDVMDILGFLTFEMVCALTETALMINNREKLIQSQKNKTQVNPDTTFETTILHRKKRLFDGPDNLVSPLKARHIEEAWRHLQILTPKQRALGTFKGNRLTKKSVFV